MAAGFMLVLDSGSPLVSVALGRDGEVVAERSEVVSRSSTRLLEMVAEVLAEAGVEPADLAGAVALQGPGSFTGLRIGLATVLGLHQALGLPATALPTLPVLAGLAPPGAARAVGAVDALRGEWTVQSFAPAGRPGTGPAPLAPLGPELLLPAAELARFAPCTIVGFGISALAALPGWPPDARLLEPGPLAPAALRLLAPAGPDWDPERLTRPLYARPPAATLPAPRRSPLAAASPAPLLATD